jgi:hypothetical protein
VAAERKEAQIDAVPSVHALTQRVIANKFIHPHLLNLLDGSPYLPTSPCGNPHKGSVRILEPWPWLSPARDVHFHQGKFSGDRRPGGSAAVAVAFFSCRPPRCLVPNRPSVDGSNLTGHGYQVAFLDEFRITLKLHNNSPVGPEPSHYKTIPEACDGSGSH